MWSTSVAAVPQLRHSGSSLRTIILSRRQVAPYPRWWAVGLSSGFRFRGIGFAGRWLGIRFPMDQCRFRKPHAT